MNKFAELPEVERRLIERWFEVKDLAENYPDPEVRRVLMDFLVALDDWFAKYSEEIKMIKRNIAFLTP